MARQTKYNFEISHEENVKLFLERLRAFLLSPHQGDGSSWPNLTHDDFEEISGAVEGMLDMKCPPDCDGDNVLSYSIWNRKKLRPIMDDAFIGVDLSREDESLLKEQSRHLANLRNLSYALGRVSNEIGSTQMRLGEIGDKICSIQNAFKVFFARIEIGGVRKEAIFRNEEEAQKAFDLEMQNGAVKKSFYPAWAYRNDSQTRRSIEEWKSSMEEVYGCWGEAYSVGQSGLFKVSREKPTV